MKYLVSFVTILIIATLGFIVKQAVDPEHGYVIGWIFGCLSIAICKIAESCIEALKEDVNE